MIKRIGITGINGWIGDKVFSYFKKKYRVINLGPYIHGKNKTKKKNLDNKIDWALHFGASTSIKKSFENPFSFYKKNIFDIFLVKL